MGSRLLFVNSTQPNIMRVLVFISCLGLTLATDPFLEFVREHGRQYRSSAELQLRRTVFMENYDSMQAHNARFEAGEVFWSRQVTPYYDHSMEEFTTIMGLGLPAYDNTTVFGDYRHGIYLAKLAEVRQCGSCAAFASV